jgi:eukaryotic-like serine/threonine-protein kinase
MHDRARAGPDRAGAGPGHGGACGHRVGVGRRAGGSAGLGHDGRMASDGGRPTAAHRPRDLVAGRYRITARLGRGGMGTVWRATDELLHRQVAVKELHLPDIGLSEAESGSQRERALREARSVARIRHPHVVVVHDVVEQDGRPWIVMELVDGRSLADVLREEGPLEPREAARICAAVAGALRAAHDHGIQHRDVKPANVLIEHAGQAAHGEPGEPGEPGELGESGEHGGTGGRVVLTDFGIARVPGSATISETGSFVGSPEYTAPERMSGRGAGPESDLWSLGALLCAAVDGRSPFHRDSIGEIVHAVAIGDITPPPTVGPLLPVVSSLLDRDPARRMAAAEVQTVLMAYARTGVEPPTPRLPTAELPAPRRAPDASAPATAGPRRTRGPVAAAVAGVTVLAVAAGAGAAFLVTRGQGTAAGADPSATATVTATPPASATGRPPTAPRGFRTVVDQAGFTVALPVGYTREAQPPRVYYWSPDHTFRFGERDQFPDPRGPYEVMNDQHVAGPATYRGYRDGVLTTTTQHGHPAALWEFTSDGFAGGGGARHTFDLCWTEGGRMYDVWLSAPVERVEQARHTFGTVRDTFRPR